MGNLSNLYEGLYGDEFAKTAGFDAGFGDEELIDEETIFELGLEKLAEMGIELEVDDGEYFDEDGMMEELDALAAGKARAFLAAMKRGAKAVGSPRARYQAAIKAGKSKARAAALAGLPTGGAAAAAGGAGAGGAMMYRKKRSRR